MDLFEMNVDLFRTINDLGKEYTYLNNFLYLWLNIWFLSLPLSL
ncbi:hypothetical protein EMIT0210MI2_11201 [Priestia megaterium]|jgi:hypothetical protein|nr:hypothetical protein [Bacillus sp. PvP124]MDR7204159.1 hypothetical protein [Priestia megaterium]MED4035362.1 hypothetical protein [Priestia megaterium]